MKLLAVLFVLWITLVSANPSDTEDGSASDPDDAILAVLETGDIVERNPYYIDASKESRKKSRQKVDAELSKSRRKRAPTAVQKRLGKISKNLKRHRVKVLAAVGIFAFRKEIKAFVWPLISEEVKDPVSGQLVRRLALTDSSTSILKLIVFAEVVRRATQKSDGGAPSPVSLLLLTGVRGTNPMLYLFLSKLLSPSSSLWFPSIDQHYTFESLNNRYQKDGQALQKVAPSAAASSKAVPASLAQLLASKAEKKYDKTIIVMDLTGLDTQVSQLDSLRDSVSFLTSEHGIRSITNEEASANPEAYSAEGESEAGDVGGDADVTNPQVEVVVLLESPGGGPSEYALASQQIVRMRKQGIKVTICVDKVAASGGYMIACTASPGQLFAAPFAVLGSIGVVGQVVNVHKALTGWGVDPIVFRGGKDKAPISALGEVTVEGKTAYQNVVDNVHRAFKRHVVEARPVLEDSIEEIATGDIWLGRDALHRGLIDRLITSDEYIAESIDGGARVLKLVRVVPSKYPFLRPTLAHVGAVRNGEGRRRSYGMLQGLLDRVLNSFVDSKSNPPLEFPPAKAAVLADLRCNVMRDVESLIEPGLRLSPSVKYAHNSS